MTILIVPARSAKKSRPSGAQASAVAKSAPSTRVLWPDGPLTVTGAVAHASAGGGADDDGGGRRRRKTKWWCRCSTMPGPEPRPTRHHRRRASGRSAARCPARVAPDVAREILGIRFMGPANTVCPSHAGNAAAVAARATGLGASLLRPRHDVRRGGLVLRRRAATPGPRVSVIWVARSRVSPPPVARRSSRRIDRAAPSRRRAPVRPAPPPPIVDTVVAPVANVVAPVAPVLTEAIEPVANVVVPVVTQVVEPVAPVVQPVANVRRAGGHAGGPTSRGRGRAGR